MIVLSIVLVILAAFLLFGVLCTIRLELRFKHDEKPVTDINPPPDTEEALDIALVIESTKRGLSLADIYLIHDIEGAAETNKRLRSVIAMYHRLDESVPPRYIFPKKESA